jgi:transcriptional regulator with XRE-family HTH domain
MMDEDYDELADVRAESEAQDPAFAGAYEDARSRSALLAQLIKVRKDLKLTQKQVAERMGTTQSAISELEGGASDPQFSTLQRYARAVTAKLVLSLDLPYDCGWNDQTLYSREGSVARVNPGLSREAL